MLFFALAICSIVEQSKNTTITTTQLFLCFFILLILLREQDREIEIALGSPQRPTLIFFLWCEAIIILSVAAAAARLLRLLQAFVSLDCIEHSLEPNAEALPDMLCSTDSARLELIQTWTPHNTGLEKSHHEVFATILPAEIGIPDACFPLSSPFMVGAPRRGDFSGEKQIC